ncbi:hypothetical protein LD669_12920 [Salmonella enterica]|nr:hypothetical protein [Salmonella enterica]MDJ7089169.1 hypothetical protein [Salmonella enterica]
MKLSKIPLLIFVVIILFIAAIPVIVYWFNFPPILSTKNADWGDFGSFVGGIYGSIFSSLSLIAVLYFSSKNEKNSRKQIELLMVERISHEFHLVLDIFKQKLHTKNFKFTRESGRSISKDDFYFMLNVRIRDHLISSWNYKNKPSRQDIYGSAYFHLKFGTAVSFDDEMKLLIYIINIISNSSPSTSEAFKVIFEASIDNNDRFFLESIIRSQNSEIISILNNWPSFSKIPSLIDKNINQPALLNLDVNMDDKP